MNGTTTTPERKFWAIRLEKAAKALEKNNFAASVHDTAREAAEYVLSDIMGKDFKGTVNFGGSASMLQAGVVDLLREHPGADVAETWDLSRGPKEVLALRKKYFFCSLYLCSTNALIMDGRLMNVDGTGNRVASMIYGPDKVVLFVGRNKLCDTLEIARDRCSNIASPMNNIRLNLPNPCAKTGKCMDCQGETRICSYWTVIEKCKPAKRIHVLLINEELGF